MVLRKLRVEEWMVNVIKSMYEGATMAVKCKGGESKEFEVKVGVHQGSVLKSTAVHYRIGSFVERV